MKHTNYIADLYDFGDKKQILRQLKLQLLTHENVIIGGSNILSRNGIELIRTTPEIELAFSENAVIPALRDSFGGIDSFLETVDNNSLDNTEKEILRNNLKHHIPWKLETATKTFEELLTSWNWIPTTKKLFFTDELKHTIVDEIRKTSLNAGKDWISPKYAKKAFKQFAPNHYNFASDYIDLAYRISGAHAVNSVAILPTNSCQLEICKPFPIELSASTADHEDSIFWDCFVGSIHEFNPESTCLSAANLDALSMKTILKIREKLIACEFYNSYGSIVKRAQQCNSISEAKNIENESRGLKEEFFSKIKHEANLKNDDAREDFLIEGASSLLKLAGDTISLGSLSAISGIGKFLIKYIAWISPENAKRIEEIRKHTRRIINGKTQTNRPLLEGYDAITIRPINKSR